MNQKNIRSAMKWPQKFRQKTFGVTSVVDILFISELYTLGLSVKRNDDLLHLKYVIPIYFYIFVT